MVYLIDCFLKIIFVIKASEIKEWGLPPHELPISISSMPGAIAQLLSCSDRQVVPGDPGS
jgi:hypothetical protein